MINLVTVGGMKWAVDVGFGANGQIQPLPLDQASTVFDAIRPASVRLVWRSIPQHTDPNQRLWAFEHRINDASEWTTNYCFSELEFLAADYEVMNYFVANSRKTIFTQFILCSRMIFGHELGIQQDADDIVGVYILMKNTLKKRVHGENEILVEFKSEEERMQALDKYFGIRFGSYERKAIAGLASEIV